MSKFTNPRDAFEHTIVNMISNPKYVNLSFYSFIAAKCKINIDTTLPAPAAVNFTGVQYNLFINPEKFNDWTLDERIAVIVHEMRHILGGHIFRKGNRNHEIFNFATDISMNQTIKGLPEGCIYPQDFKLTDNFNAEQYYEKLLENEDIQKMMEVQKKADEAMKDAMEKANDGAGEEGEGDGQGQPQAGDGSPMGDLLDRIGKSGGGMGDHSKWDESEVADEDMAKAVTEKMIEDAVQKSRGNLPADIDKLLELWRRKPVISWKKELKRIMASKRGYKISTLKRRDRRFPNRRDLRGHKTTRDNHEIVVGIDTSGSMSDSEIVKGLVEINEICKVTGSSLKIVQIDTEIKSIEEYDEKKKTFKRRGCGGTYMGAIVPFLEEQGIKEDVLIMISDMYIEDVNNDSNWAKYKKPVLWLATDSLVPDWNGWRKHKVMDITKA